MNINEFIKYLKTDEFLEYFIVYMIPSSTPLYILINTSWNILGFNWIGLSIIWSYIYANLIGVVLCYYLFKSGIISKIQQFAKKLKK